MNNEKPVSAALYFKGEKVADLDLNIRESFFDLDDIGLVDHTSVDNGYVLNTSRVGGEDYPYITRTKHLVITRGEWVTIARSPNYIAARVAHKIWLYALGSNDALIDAYVINQFDAERKDK